MVALPRLSGVQLEETGFACSVRLARLLSKAVLAVCVIPLAVPSHRAPRVCSFCHYQPELPVLSATCLVSLIRSPLVCDRRNIMQSINPICLYG